MTTRADIVAQARSYLDTPWHHIGREPGLGIDCAGIWICLARDLGLVASDFDVPAYTERPDGRTLIAWCERYMGERVQRSELAPGHGVVLISDQFPQHLAVVGDYKYGGLSIIHAANNAEPPRVIETRLMFHERMKFCAAFEFPGVTE